MKAQRYATVLTAMMLGLAMLASAGMAAPDSSGHGPGSGPARSVSDVPTEPAMPPNLPAIADDQVAGEIGFDDIAQVVNKQKLKIKLPPQAFMTFAETCIEAFPGLFFTTNRFNETILNDCPRAADQLADASALLPEQAWSGLLGGNGLIGINGDSWVQSPAGAERPFGTFAPVRVHALAFGSVPITATVHISQSVRDGLVQPLSLQWSATGGYVQEGVVIPGYGASPGYPYAFTLPAKFDGPIDIRLSDVEVDGVPLPVGSGCAAPAILTMNPTPGYSRIDYADHPPARGLPGEFTPYWAPSYLSGSVDIKAFSGCRNGVEPLDPLLTGMISGAGNPIDTTMSNVLDNWCAGPDGVGKVYCDINQTPLEGQSAAALRAIGLAPTKQEILEEKKPSASEVRKLRKVDTRGMSKPVREAWKTMMKSLPPQSPAVQ